MASTLALPDSKCTCGGSAEAVNENAVASNVKTTLYTLMGFRKFPEFGLSSLLFKPVRPPASEWCKAGP